MPTWSNQVTFVVFMDLSSHIEKFIFNLFVRYSSLKNPAFWLALRFLGHNWRTRFFPKVKGLLTLPCWSQKVYISELIRFLLKAEKTHFVETFCALRAHLNFYSKTRIFQLSYFRMSKWQYRDVALQTDGKVNKTKFMEHFSQGGCWTIIRTT